MSTELLAVPVKKPSEVDVVKPLKNLIQSAYSASSGSSEGGAPAVDYATIVNDFGKLRNTAIWKFYEKYEASLDVVNG